MADQPGLTELPIVEFLDRLAEGTPTPGGGAAAALAGALAAALTSMVGNLTLGRPEFAAVAEEVERLVEESEACRVGLTFGVEADAAAYGLLAKAYKLPRASEAERQTRRTAIRAASTDATREPLEIARLCVRVLDICTRLAEIGNPRILSDVSVAAMLAGTGLLGAVENVEVNLPAMGDDPFAAEARAELRHLLGGRQAQVDAIVARARQRK